MSARLIPGLSRCGGTPSLNFVTDILAGGAGSTTTTISLAWHPSSKFVAMIGYGGPTAGLYIFSFNGTSLTQVTYSNVASPYSCNWDKTGNYLCVTYSLGTNSVVIYQWDGVNTLTQVTQITNTGGNYNACVGCAWHPQGNYLALTWDSFSTLVDRTSVTIYSWNGSNTLSLVASAVPASGFTIGWSFYPTWNPAGTFLAAVGQGGYNQNAVQMWAWNGSNSITLVDSKSYSGGYGGFTTGWSRDGKTVFYGLWDTVKTILAFSWNGTSLTLLNSIAGGSGKSKGYLSVNACGNYIFVGFSDQSVNSSRILEYIYEWSSSTNTFTLKSSGTAIASYGPVSVGFSPDDKYVASGMMPYNVSYQKNLRISSTNLFNR